MCSCSRLSFTDSCALRPQYLGSVSVPAQVLREAVEADVVGLTLRPRRAEGQAVAVLLHLLHLQRNEQSSGVTESLNMYGNSLQSE